MLRCKAILKLEKQKSAHLSYAFRRLKERISLIPFFTGLEIDSHDEGVHII